MSVHDRTEHWPIFQPLFPLCLPLFLTHSRSDSTQILTHKYTCANPFDILNYTCSPHGVSKLACRWDSVEEAAVRKRMESVRRRYNNWKWEDMFPMFGLSSINLNSCCRYVFSVSCVFLSVVVSVVCFSIKHQVTAALNPIQSRCSKSLYPGFLCLLLSHYSYLCWIWVGN